MFEESSQQPRAEEQGEPGSVSQAEGVNVPQQQEVAPQAQETGPAPVQEEPVNAAQEQSVQEAPAKETVRPAEEANVAPGQGAETSVAQEQAPEAAPEHTAEAPPKVKAKSKGVKAKSAPGSKGVKAKPETAATEAPVKESLTVAPETTPDLSGMDSFGKDDYKAYSPIVKKQMDAEVNIRRKAMVLTSTIDKIHYQAQEAILKDAIEAHPEMVEVLQEPKRLSLDQKGMLKRILSKQAAPAQTGDTAAEPPKSEVAPALQKGSTAKYFKDEVEVLIPDSGDMGGGLGKSARVKILSGQNTGALKDVPVSDLIALKPEETQAGKASAEKAKKQKAEAEESRNLDDKIVTEIESHIRKSIEKAEGPVNLHPDTKKQKQNLINTIAIATGVRNEALIDRALERVRADTPKAQTAKSKGVKKSGTPKVGEVFATETVGGRKYEYALITEKHPDTSHTTYKVGIRSVGSTLDFESAGTGGGGQAQVALDRFVEHSVVRGKEIESSNEKVKALFAKEKLRIEKIEAEKTEKQRAEEQKQASERAAQDAWEAHLKSIPLKGKKGEVKIKQNEGEDTTESGTIYGDFAIRKTGGVWPYSITHIPTGLKAAKDLSLEKAKNIIKAIHDSGVNTSWSSSKDAPDGALKTMANIVRSVSGDAIPEYFTSRDTAKAEVKPTKEAPAKAELKGLVEGKDLASTNVSELPKRASGAGEALSQHSIIAGMARHYDVPLRRGGLRKKAGVKVLGEFKRFAGVVRVDKDHVGDIGLMSHEVAHKLDQQYKITADMPFTLRTELSALDYDQERNPEDMTGSVPTAVREGFAEYIRHYFWTFDNPKDYDEVASEVKRLIGVKAPTFHAFFENWVKQHPGLSAKMETTREEIYNWRRAGDLEREMKNLSRTGKAPDRRSIRERIRDLFTTNYTGWKDKGHIFDLFSRKAKDLGFVGSESVYQLYLAFDQSGPAMAARAAEHGVFKMTGKMEKIGPKFGEILEEIPLEDQDKFELWAWARHSIECWSKDVNPGMSLAAAQNIYETHKTDAFERAAVKLTEYNNALIDMLTDVGVLEDDKVALVDGKEEIIPGEGSKMKEHWQTYLTLRRVRSIPSAGQLLSSRAVPSGKKYANLTDPIMRRVGSGDMVYSPLQSALERTQQFYTRAAQQVVINQMVETIGTTPGMGAFAEHIMTPIKRTAIKLGDVAENLKKQYDVDLELPKGVQPETVVTMFSPDLRVQKGGKAIIRHTLNGVTSFYEVDPEFYKALTGMNFLTTPLIFEPIAAIARSIRAGATGLSTTFAGANIVRDYMTYLMQTKYGEGATQFTEPLKQIFIYAASEVDKLRGGEGDIFVELYKGMAGEMATTLGSDLRKFRKFIESQMRQPMSKKVLREMNPMNFIEMARKIINLSEVGPRMAEFEAVMKKYGITKESARKDGVPRRILVEGINAANDVTINFKRAGSWGQFVNRYIPFFNAGLEGQDKYIRTWRDNPKRAAVGTGAMVIAQILYWLYRKDDDDYKDQPGWLKYFFWTFADANGQTFLRLPRPFEWNIIPSGVEMLLNHHESETGGEFSKWLWEMISRQSPSIKFAGATQAIETFFNFDFFRWDDIYKGDKYNKTLASKQYLDHTTETMKAIGEWTGIAPYRLEHFINSTTGGLYKKLVGTGEAATINAYNTIWGLPDPEKKGQSTVENAYYSFVPLTLRKNYTQSEVDFNNELDAAERQYNASRTERGKDGDPKLKAELWRLNQYKSLISEIKGLVFQQAGRTEKFNFEKYVNGLSRQALGKENLDLYPSPFKTNELPTEVREIRDEFLGRIIYQVTSPMKTKSPEEVKMTKERAAEWLDNLSADEKRRLLLQEARARKHGVDSIISRLGRLNRLD